MMEKSRRASWLIGLIVLALGLGGISVQASAATTLTGHLEHAAAVKGGKLSVSGWAIDPSARTTSIQVDVYVDGRRIGRYPTSRTRPDVNRKFHARGNHGFALTITRPRAANLIRVYAVHGRASRLLAGSVRLIKPPTAGARIIAQARKYLGVPYVYGGASPASGFDCSGYTMYVYRHASVATLVHNAESQRHQVRIIARSAARPGDLIFYLSRGSAYHVAIYAGGNSQYAAPAPGQRVKLEGIWSSSIQFGTDWH
jgi:cell wall-associated NlpC family hydrolase